MAATISAGVHPVVARGIREYAGRRTARRISPEAGRALEILGHSIEYLTDEYVNRTGKLSANDPEIEAIQLLMGLNRQVYYGCPVVPTWSERLWTFLRGATY